MQQPGIETVAYNLIDSKGKDLNEWTYEIERYKEKGEVNVDGKIVQVGKGWVPFGGIRLKNVYHGGYRLAFDIGVVGLWVFPGRIARENGHKPKYLVLGPPDFLQTDESGKLLSPDTPFQILTSKRKTGAAYTNIVGSGFDPFFSGYSTFLKVRWRSNYRVFGENSPYLSITQRYVLSRYSDSPAHEPTGNLKAARLHPLIEIDYPDNGDGYVSSIRVDYRLYLNLDSFIKTKYAITNPYTRTPVEREVQYQSKPDKSGKPIANQAGLFKDDDSGLPVRDGFGQAEVVFAAAEKPLLYEVIADGLIRGWDRTFTGQYKALRTPLLGRKVAGLPVYKINTWDNVHWWAVGEKMPSTPGAFHAAHLHWRWGSDIRKNKGFTSIATDYAGQTQFRGTGDVGALVDPGLSNQTIRVAIITNKGIPAEITAQSSEEFETFFKNHGGSQEKLPEEIENGGDLILYYSAEVFMDEALPGPRRPTKNPRKLNGNLFVHGIFFAHETETGDGGTQGPYYENPSKRGVYRQWKRSPKIS